MINLTDNIRNIVISLAQYSARIGGWGLLERVEGGGGGYFKHFSIERALI